jgi:hypothetical protein
VGGGAGFIGGWAGVHRGCGQWHGAVATPNGEHGVASARQGAHREQAHRGEGRLEVSLAWPWELERPAALYPRLGDHQVGMLGQNDAEGCSWFSWRARAPEYRGEMLDMARVQE